MGVWPHPELAHQLARRFTDHRITDLRWVEEQNLHVTLRFLGDVDPEQVPAITGGIAGAVAGVGSLVARLGPATATFGGSILHVPVDGLDDLAARVIAATADVGQPPEDRPFRGHLTLARVRGRRGRIPSGLVGQPVDTSWTVRAIGLMSSDLTADGPSYRTVAPIPLTTAPAG